MRKLLAWVLINLSIVGVTNADDFKRLGSFTCGPKKLEIFENYKTLGSERTKYFFVNTASNGNFVILNDDIQYTNFRDTILSQIYHQNGGTFRATMKLVDGVLMYRLVNKDDDFVLTFNVDVESSTYIARVTRGDKKFEQHTGVCWLDQ